MNLLFDRLKGNERLKQRLWSLLSTGTLPQALILEGGEGSGKKTLSMLLSQTLACLDDNAPCGVCDNCRKIEEDICPDVISVDVADDKKFITVDQIRALREEAFIRPNDCEVKVFIIKNASRLNIQTQNMLLKILEEPPQATYFFLLCESSASLLPTVKSRAPVLKLQHFDEAQLEKHLTEISFTASQLSKSDRTAFSQLLQSADGSIGKALALLNEKDENGGEAYRKADLLIELLCGQEPPNQHGLLSFFKNAFAGREDGGAFFDELSKAFRDLLAVKKSRRRCRLLFFRDMETASERAYSLSVQSLCELIEQTMYFRTLLTDGNANLTLIKNTFADAVYRAV